MCGICGLLTADQEQPIDRDLLKRMNDRLRHRGPDDEGFYVDARVGLGMRRLAIIDVAGGQQPISNEDGSIVVVFNGEIYNFQAVRSELEKSGHKFSTHSDTEVIVHGYEQWGDAVLNRLNGMFAIALWDRKNDRLLLARDRMGKKPIYWHYSSEGLVWGSEAKAVLLAPWIDRRINPLALHHYLTLQYIPDPLTIYADIQRLPAAHKLVIDSNGPPQVSRWWQLAFEPKLNLPEREVIVQARVLLSAAVQRRLISEVPLGAFLSGGIDSALTVALMAEQLAEPVKTFSIGFEEQHYSETRYAQLIADRYQTDHHEFIFRPADIIQVIEGVVAAFDEPFADPAALPLYELSRQTRQHVTVALSGDGGDETLAGYRRYVYDGLLRPYAALPKWFTQRTVPAFARWLPDTSMLPEDRNPITAFKRLGQFSSVTPKASLVRWGSYFTHDQKLGLYTDRWRDELTSINTAAIIAQAFDAAHAASFLDRTLSADHMTYLSGDLLPKTDRMSMAHSVEARAPFLDADWVEWTACLPDRYKVRGLHTKWLLTAAFADKLPPEILKRGKQGFGVPIGVWLRHDLCTWTRDRLTGNSELDRWFRPEAIQQLLIEHDSGKINHGKKLWALVMFAVWQERAGRQTA